MTINKFFIALALIILIIGLISKFSQNQQKTQPFMAVQKPVTISPQINVSAIASSTAQLNLQGPFVCQYSTPQASMSGYIKANKILGQVKSLLQTKNILLNGDCLYLWDTTSTAGQKICGLTQYLSLLNYIPLSSFLGNSQLLSKLPAQFNEIPKLLGSCKHEEIQDEKIFLIPANVVFKTK